MPMNGTARGDTDYNAIISLNPNWGLLNSGEQSLIRLFFEAIFSADTTYIVGNADVLPLAHSGPNLNNPIGQPLLVPGNGILDSRDLNCSGDSIGAQTSAPQDIQGKGKIL